MDARRFDWLLKNTSLPEGRRRVKAGGDARTSAPAALPAPGIRQAEIAETLHLSQAKVSRLLKRAAETGIVRTVVVVSQGGHTEMEEALEQRYGLAEAVVVDVEGQAIVTGLGSAAAGHLESTVTGVNGSVSRRGAKAC